MNGASLPSGLDAALAAHGLIARGAIAFAAGEAAPPGPSGATARAVILVGHGGGTIWPYFSKWLAAQPETPDDPLDTWSRAVLEPVAARFGARAAFPFDRPWLPFQQWAVRAEGLRPSPLGILMHPEFGLWHAWRGALLFDVDIAVHAPREPIHLCDACDGKPCIKACPASAVSGEGFGVEACTAHLVSPQGDGCRTTGCLSRAACPVDAYRYDPEQTAFHMTARLRGLDSGAAGSARGQ